ncbi:unnamed protein product [Cylicocyclus nassatus]|uniref:EGF-like domain-containing protein n=1 Tax=Cylicocyclus nassatus TaxID=53992 RepID=A0AA36H737_CYLNA|nr:unnamed protein product [Cylicocyclus nassatus]
MARSVDRSWCVERCNERGICFEVAPGGYRCVCYDPEVESTTCGSEAASTKPAAATITPTWELMAAALFGFIVLLGVLVVICGHWRRRCRTCLDRGRLSIWLQAVHVDGAKATPIPNSNVRTFDVDNREGTLKSRTPATALPLLSVSMTNGSPSLGATRIGAVNKSQEFDFFLSEFAFRSFELHSDLFDFCEHLIYIVDVFIGGFGGDY